MKTSNKTASKRHLLIAVIAAMALAMGMLGLSACGDNSSASSSAAPAPASSAAPSDSGTSADDPYADLEPVKYLYADIASPGSAENVLSEGICERVAEITGGKFTIDYHGNGELGTGPDIVRQLEANEIQFVYIQPAMLVSFIPAMAVFDQHMLFANADPDAIETVLNGDNEFTKRLEAAYNEVGLHNLGFMQNGTFRETTSNKELRTLEDFKGFQIRTMENANHMAFWSAIGAEPTPLAFAELYIALQNGTVQGEENATDTAVGNSLQEVQKYLCLTHHVLYSGTINMNLEAWNDLDPAYQAALEQAIEESLAEVRPQLQKFDKDNQQVMVDAGMEIIEYDQDFFDAIAANEGVQKLNEDIAKQTDGLNEVLQAELEKASK